MNSIRKNFLYNLFYQILSICLPLITAPYVSRALGVTALGIYSYVNSVAYYFLIIAMLGLSNYGSRSIATVQDDPNALDRIFSSIYGLQCLTFSIAIIIYTGYVTFFVRENKLIYLIHILYVLSGMLDISWLFFGLEKFKITVTVNTLIKASTVGLIFLFVHHPTDLWKYTLIMSLGSLLGQAYMWFFRRKFVSFVRITAKELIGHLKPVVVLFVPVLAYSIYKVMDKIMLGQMTAFDQVGFYNSAEKIISIPMGVITALGTVMLPRMTNQITRGDWQKTDQYIRVSVKVVTIIASAAGFGIIGISDVFAPVFFGNGFEPCAPIIQLLAMSVFFVAWANVIRTQYLIPNHLDNIYMISTLAGAAVNLVINICLIPRLHAVGAAIGTLTAEFSVFAIQIMTTKKKLAVCDYIFEYIPILLIGALMAVVVHRLGLLMDKSLLTIVVQIACGGAIYILLAYMFLRAKKDELYYYIAFTREKNAKEQ